MKAAAAKSRLRQTASQAGSRSKHAPNAPGVCVQARSAIMRRQATDSQRSIATRCRQTYGYGGKGKPQHESASSRAKARVQARRDEGHGPIQGKASAKTKEAKPKRVTAKEKAKAVMRERLDANKAKRSERRDQAFNTTGAMGPKGAVDRLIQERWDQRKAMLTPPKNEKEILSSAEKAFAEVRRENSPMGGIVRVPDLVDKIRAKHPELSGEQVRSLLKRWEAQKKITLQFANDRRNEKRAAEGIESKPYGARGYKRRGGLQMYVEVFQGWNAASRGRIK